MGIEQDEVTKDIPKSVEDNGDSDALKNMTMSMSVSDLEQKHEFIDENENNNIETIEENDNNNNNDNADGFSSKQKCWNQFTNKIRQGISLVVVSLAVHAARYPYLYIFGTVLVSLGLIIAGAMTNLTVNVDPDVLFSPSNTVTSEHHDWLLNFNPNQERRLSSQQYNSFLPEEAIDFDYEESEYQALLTDHQMMMSKYNGWGFGPSQQQQHKLHGERRRLQGWGTTLTVLLHANGENVVSQEGIQNLFITYETIQDSVPGCRRRRCRSISALNLWDNNRTFFEETVQSDQDVIDMLSSKEYEDGEPVDLRSLAGKAEVSDSGTITYAASFIILMNLPVRYNPDIFGRNFGDGDDDDYERDVIQNVLSLKQDLACQNSQYTLEIFTLRAFEDELFRGIAEDVPLLPLVILIMILFTCFAFFKCDRVRSKCLLGLGGVLTIVLSIMSGYGLMFCCGLPFTPMTSILPFVVLGVGLDDTFIISLAFNRTDENKDPVERMRDTMNEVGLSISVTTLTTTLAFVFGMISSIPSIYWMVMYGFTTILIDFIYQITFFVALVVLDARRIKANRSDCCTCITVKKHLSSSPSNEGEGEEGDGVIISPANASNEEEIDNQKSTTTHLADRIMDWYAKQLLRPWTKVFVIVVFLGYLVACIFCTTLMEQAFRISDLTPTESFIRTFFRSMQDYTTRSTAVMIYFRNVDQADPQVRQEMRNYIDDLVAIPAFGEQPSFCWVNDFDDYVELIPNHENMSFEDQVEEMLYIPVVRMLYGHQIRRNRTGVIKMSRCQIWFSNLDLYDVQNQLDAFRAQRQLSIDYADGEEEWPYFTWDMLYYLWEFYNIVVHELILTTLSAVVAVSIVTLLVVPHWSAILYVLPTIIILYIDLIGTLQFVGVRINAISYLALVISIGVMVDFILHMLMKYFESKRLTREEKVKDALRTMGASILLGGLSTFIATIPVLFASSQLFKDIFDSFFALVTLSICHGLIFLPVVLSLVGPIVNNDHYVPANEPSSERSLPKAFFGGRIIDAKENEADNMDNLSNKQLVDGTGDGHINDRESIPEQFYNGNTNDKEETHNIESFSYTPAMEVTEGAGDGRSEDKEYIPEQFYNGTTNEKEALHNTENFVVEGAGDGQSNDNEYLPEQCDHGNTSNTGETQNVVEGTGEGQTNDIPEHFHNENTKDEECTDTKERSSNNQALGTADGRIDDREEQNREEDDNKEEDYNGEESGVFSLVL